MVRHRKKKNNLSHGDVSIADCADNPKPFKRISKSRIVETRSSAAADAMDPVAEDPEETDPPNTTPAADHKRTRRKKGAGAAAPDEDHVYNIYHIDIWCEIAKHIRPEDVSTFSRICQNTAYVCRTANFWKQLYHRVYSDSPSLPVRLQPHCMVRVGGLRTCTIRSLFHMHPPLMSRLAMGEQQSIVQLRRRECVSTWMVQVKDTWHYCFKLKEHLIAGSRMERSERLRRRNIFEKVQRDIFQNADEGCKLLVVKMSAMRPLPQLFGHESYLDDIKMSLSTGCVKHKLVLSFVGTGREYVANVVYEPVDEVRVLDWWTPAYQSFEANMCV